MAQIDLIANNLAGNLDLLKSVLADFSDADMLIRPVPDANHAAWQLGHLAFFEAMVCGMYVPSKAPTLPADSKTLYGKEGASIDDPSRFFTKDEGLKILGQTRAALVDWARTLTEADLAKPGPEQFKGWVNTIGDLLITIIVHTTMHVGQFQVIRRKLGKKILM